MKKNDDSNDSLKKSLYEGGDTKGNERKRISTKYVFDLNNIILRQQGDYVNISVINGRAICKPGEPSLPWIKAYISLPKGVKPVKILTEEKKIKTLKEGVLVEPCQPDIPTILGSRLERVGPSMEIYSSEDVWPKINIRMTTIRYVGDQPVLELEICPFEYYPGLKRLNVIYEQQVVILCDEQKHLEMRSKFPMNARYRERTIKRVEEIVLNPEAVRQQKEAKDLEITPSPGFFLSFDYVIITSTALASTFGNLAKWKQLMGHSARVVTIEDIVAGSVPDSYGTTFWETGGYADGGTRDLGEAIRNFIQWASINWLTEYVLLGGDISVIPARYALSNGVGNVYYSKLTDSDENSNRGLSAFSSTAATGTTASAVLDDDQLTLWRCAQSDSAPWIQIRLDSNTPINKIKLTWGTTRASSLTIQTSKDAINWVDTLTESSGSLEEFTFPCISSSYVRIRITSGSNFELSSVRIYGIPQGWYWSNAYAVGKDAGGRTNQTRIYLGTWLYPSPNLTNSTEGNLLIVSGGPLAGTIIPYNEQSGDQVLGWHFVTDMTTVPSVASTSTTRFIEIRGPNQYHDQPFVLKYDMNTIPADLYYSDVSVSEYSQVSRHDWDKDNNGVYGEQYGGQIDAINGLPDVMVGRAPVETVDEAETFVKKCINYEKYVTEDNQSGTSSLPDEFAISVLLGSQNYSGNDPGHLDTSANGKENIRRMLLNKDPGRWNMLRRYEDYADVPLADQGLDLGPASSNSIMDGIREGRNAISLSSHGNSSYLCYLNTNNIDDLVNNPSIFYANSCLTAMFDVAGGDSFGEWAILNPHGGAVAYVGNSRYGWTSDGPIELSFWTEMLNSGRLGKMWRAMKMMGVGWQSYSLNLLGDPSLRVWSERPKRLSVTHPKTLYAGLNDLEVTVLSNGVPVENAQVSLVYLGSMLALGDTDANGKVVLRVNARLTGLRTGSMGIGVSGKNLVPYTGSIGIRPLLCVAPVDCRFNIGCNVLVSCPLTLSCRSLLVCKDNVICGSSIVCQREINCAHLISQGCRILVSGCQRIKPHWEEIPREAPHIIGQDDIEHLDDEEVIQRIEKRLELLSDEEARQIRMMLDKIRKERPRG